MERTSTDRTIGYPPATIISVKLQTVTVKWMNRNQRLLSGVLIIAAIVTVVVIVSHPFSEPGGEESGFPDFFTKNEDYFIYRLGSIPQINREDYQLRISGMIDSPSTFTLDELRSLNLVDLPLTVECIGNSRNGDYVSTAVWRGFNVYELLQSLGLSDNATVVGYTAADGYYVSHTLEQVKNNGVLGALYMNEVEIPPEHGFPLRILHPGYYGVEHPAWVVGIEVLDTPLEDYWAERGWNTSAPMTIDSKILFPRFSTTILSNETLRVGGCAYGGTRVKIVEYTLDDGSTWHNATIVQEIDADNVWVFWEVNVTFSQTGQFVLQTKATDIHDNQQIEEDGIYTDGIDSWPGLTINVE